MKRILLLLAAALLFVGAFSYAVYSTFLNRNGAAEIEDLRQVNSIQQEINRRGTKLEKDVKAFQDKIDKGLLTRSVAEVQGQKLQQQQNSFQQYAAQKQQEMAEEQQVMLNQIGDAIKTFLDEFNAEKQYAMILSTQGGVLPAPVAAADSELDITDAILEGLNAAYVKTKAKETK